MFFSDADHCILCKHTGKSKNGKYPCRRCNGSGKDPEWYFKRCAAPGMMPHMIRVNRKWSNIPKFCKECSNEWLEKNCARYGCAKRVRYKRTWSNIPNYCSNRCEHLKTKSCKNCTSTVEYMPNWNNIPDYCKNCQAWQEKSCKECSSIVQYKIFWKNIPDYCKSCLKKDKVKKCTQRGCDHEITYKISWKDIPTLCGRCYNMRKKGFTARVCETCKGVLWLPPGKKWKKCKSCDDDQVALFRRELVPSGWGSVMTGITRQPHNNNHVTIIFKGKGTNGKAYRVSWDGQGKPHWTDQGLPKNHPNRHRDPR